jgi:NAD+ diphosphatase
MTFVHAVEPPPESGRFAWWFLYHGDRLLVDARGDAVRIPFGATAGELGVAPVRQQYLGALDGTACRSGQLAAPIVPAGMALQPLRSLLGVLPEPIFALAGRAFQIVEWDRSHQYCGACGLRTEAVGGERAKACAPCGLQFYPRISPAVIVAVVRERTILLARARRFPSVFFSVLAGFVEAGENFEECVRREVMEETGIAVENVRYFGSQPWPFPHSLMVGFTAEYAGGEIVPEEKEIVQAGWFGPEEVPRLQIPRHGTIARELIDWFLAVPDGRRDAEDDRWRRR